MKPSLHKVLVYGTLRPGLGETVQVPGKLYDLGWYPGIKLGDDPDTSVTCEVIEVDNVRLEKLDSYEGYVPSSPEQSLYLRTYLDQFGAWIYVYNSSVDNYEAIESGDWLQHTSRKAGVNSSLALMEG